MFYLRNHLSKFPRLALIALLWNSFATAAAVASPLVLMNAPTEGGFITTADYDAFVFSGFCSEEGRDVVLGGPVSQTTTCSGQSWSITLDLSYIFDGPLTFTVDHSDALGNYSPTVQRHLVKDTIPPFGNKVIIGDGITPPTSTSVTLNITSTGATEMYLSNSAGCPAGGMWQPFSNTLPWQLVPNGTTAALSILFRDNAGNLSSCLNKTIPLNISSAPVIAFTTPTLGTIINLSNTSALQLGGTCSENGQTVTISGSATAAAVCSSASWSTTVDLSGAPDGTVSFTATLPSSSGQSTNQTNTYIKDATLPLVLISTPADGAFVNIANQATFALTGVCSEEGRAVVISGTGVSANTNCTSGAWSATLNMSLIADGNISITASHQDAAGNLATSPVRTFFKDTVAPMAGTLVINGGALITNNASATLTLNATNAIEMYLTSVSGCATGGVYQLYATSAPWTLQPIASVASVFAKFRDAAGNESACITASIQFKTSLPLVAITSPAANGAFVNSSNAAAYTVSGTCSEEARTVILSGNTSSSATCLSGSWSALLNLTSVADGSLTLNADLQDAAGNRAIQATRTLTKDTIAPTSNSVTIAAGATYTTTSTVALSLASTGASDMYVTNVAGCSSGGAWETYATSKTWTLGQTNAMATVFAQFRDLAGNLSACVSDTIIHDSLVPTVAITAPAAGSLVSANNSSAFGISGTCSEEGRTINLTGAVTATALCTTGAWTAQLNLNTLADGPLTMNADLQDAAGNSAVRSSRTFSKDTQPPSGNSIIIAGGATYTTTTAVTLTLASVGASDMYITNVAGCMSGGAWETFNINKPWTLGQTNAVATVYAQFRDLAGNPSPCLSSTIIHDNLIPTVTIITPALGGIISTSNSTAVILSGTCSEAGQNVAISGAATASTPCSSGNWSKTFDLSQSPDGTLTFFADLKDAAGNAATQASRAVTKDTVSPTQNSIAINAGAPYTNSTAITLTLGSSGATSMYVTNTAGCAAGGIWESFSSTKPWTLGQTNSLATVYASFRTAAGNTSACINATITHDSIAPTVAITSPSAGSIVSAQNAASFRVSGTCSEEARTVNLSGAVAATATCTTGLWSVQLNLSGVADGALTLNADLQDIAGNNAIRDTKTFTKDTQAPTASSIVIAGGAPYTTSVAVSLTLASTGASDMYVTNTAGCASGGTWETMNVTRAWTLGQTNATATVYAQFRDVAGNTTSCISASIIHDNLAPTLTFATPLAGSTYSLATVSKVLLSGTCSEAGQNVAISGAIIDSIPCVSGAWSKNVDLTALADGSLSLAADLKDAAGNAAIQATKSIVKDTQAPTANSVIISADAVYTTSSSVGLTLSSTGASDMYVTNIAGCASGGVWETYSTSKTWVLAQTNAVATVYAQFRDSAGNVSVCVNDTIIHDSIIPTVAITSPVVGTPVSIANVAAFTVSGTCSEETRTVSLSGSSSGSAVCTSGAWTTSLNLTTVADGTVTLNADHQDAAGNSALRDTKTFIKDTLAPTNNSIVIAGGAAYTSTTAVLLTLASTGAANMYVTNIAGCASGGIWEPLSPTKAWILGQTNGIATVYAAFKDLAGNTTACINSTIIHDNIQPILTFTAPAAGSFVSSLNVTAVVVSGSCSEAGQNVTLSGAATASIPCASGSWSKAFDLSSAPEGSLAFAADLKDTAGNAATQATLILVKDTLPPSPNSIVIAGGAATTSTTAVTLTLSSVGATAMYVTNSAVCTAGGIWETFATTKAWTLGQTNSLATVYASFKDAAGNVSPCVNATILHKSTAPQLSITSPSAGSFISSLNVTAFVVSGTCSESGQNVMFSGAIVDSTPCTSGIWAKTFNLSSLSDGQVTLVADLKDVAGNPAVQATRSFTKDTLAPSPNSIVIGSGAPYTTTTAVTLALLSGGASEMYITNVAGCASGGVWEPYATSKNWTLGQTNAVATVYASFRDPVGNASVCASASIIHDNIAPLPPVFVRTVPVSPGASTTPFVIGSAPSADTALVSLYRELNCLGNVLASSTKGAFESTGLQVIATANAATNIYGRTTDAAGNASTCVLLTTYTQRSPVLTISPTTLALPSGSVQTFTFTAAGGTAPYRFSVVSGDGSIDSATGLYTASATAVTTTIVRAMDATNLTADATVTHTRQPNVLVDGTVLAIGVDVDGNRYLGGKFTRAFGTLTPNIIGLDTNGVPLSAFDVRNGFDGPVYATAFLADGSLIVGGAFAHYRGAPANDIAKLSPTGELDATFSPATGANGFVGDVRALAVDLTNNRIYAGGNFTSYRGAVANHLAKLDPTGAVDLTFSPASGANGADGPVYALNVFSTSVFVGGNFKNYRGTLTNSIAKVVTATGALDPGFSLSAGTTGFDGSVLALATNSNNLFVGGAFKNYRASPALGIAKLSLSGVLSTDFNPITGANGVTLGGGTVNAIALNASAVYIAGDFLDYRGTLAQNLAKLTFDGGLDKTFNPTSGNNGTIGTVAGLALRENALFAVGSFTYYQTTLANGIAKINATTGATDLSLNPATSGFLKGGAVPKLLTITLSPDRTRVIVGGDISGSMYGGYGTNGLIKIKTNGGIDQDFLAAVKGINGDVNAIAISGRDIYIGGAFTQLNGKTANRIAKLSQAGALDLTITPQNKTNGFDDNVYAIAISGNSVYVGGSFNTYSGRKARALVKLGAILGDQDTGFCDGGGCDKSGGCSGNGNGNGNDNGDDPNDDDGGVNLAGFGPAVEVRALALDASGSSLYVGGKFHKFKKLKTRHIAKIFTATGQVDTVFNPQKAIGKSNGANGNINTLVFDKATVKLYVAGNYKRYRGDFANPIFRVTPDGAVDSSFNAVPNGDVTAIAVNGTGTQVFIGGTMTKVGTATVNYLTKLNASGVVDAVFSPTTGSVGVNNPGTYSTPVAALWVDGPQLLVGGAFTQYRQDFISNYLVMDLNGNLAH